MFSSMDVFIKVPFGTLKWVLAGEQAKGAGSNEGWTHFEVHVYIYITCFKTYSQSLSITTHKLHIKQSLNSTPFSESSVDRTLTAQCVTAC